MKKVSVAAFICVFSAFLAFAQGTIGISFGNDFFSRRAEEREAMISILKANGCNVLVREAGLDAKLQADQIRIMVSQGASVLIVAAVDGERLAPLIDELAVQGVQAIAYDAVMRTASVAVNVCFDYFEIGRFQALGILAALGPRPKGRIVLLGGSPTDPAAHLLRLGQIEVLNPLIDRGDLIVVADQWVENWDPANAKKVMGAIIKETRGDFDAVAASNDGTALGALESLKTAGLAGKVLISGMDASAAGCNSIARGELTFTVLKDQRLLPPTVCDIALKLSRNADVPGLVRRDLSEYMSDWKLHGEIVCKFLSSVTVTKDNMKIVIVDTGYQDYDRVYKDIVNPPPR
jgi:D-xylose transport system substrate-binding protein